MAAVLKVPPIRQHVQQVALEMFVTQGFQAVSLRQLAAAIGLQAGSLYNHIESKQALLFELMEDHELRLNRALHSPRAIDTDSLKALGNFVRGHVGFTLRNPQTSELARLEFRSLEPQQRLAIDSLREQHAGRLQAILKQGTQQGVFKPSPATASWLLTMLGEASHWQRAEHSVALVAELYMRMLRGVLIVGQPDTAA